MVEALKSIVDPDIYDRHYYLTDNEGCREYELGLDSHMHPKFRLALELAQLVPGEQVLDIGCGRGEILYYCAKRGIRALGLDYSQAAVEIVRQTLAGLPRECRELAEAEQADAVDYEFGGKFDAVFMIEIYEHLYERQLAKLFTKIHRLLTDRGRLIVITPNYYYEKYLRPIKMASNIPFNLVKWPLRVIRGKFRPKSLSELMGKMLRVRVDRGELEKKMHVNVSTVSNIRRSLRDFQVNISCRDHSLNPISLVTQKWWGREIVAIAGKKPQTS